MTPTEFVEARLTETETLAAAVTSWGELHTTDPVFLHIARHSPTAVTRSCAAQRAALAAGSEPVAVALAGAWDNHPDFDPDWVAPAEPVED